MVARSLLGPRQVTRLKHLRQRGFTTARRFHDDAFVCWRTVRSSDWGTTTTPEADEVVMSGTGRLYENGPGGPIAGENVIHIESPYRFRTAAWMVDPNDVDAVIAVPIESGHELVINGDRLFRVESVKREDDDDQLVNVFLAELVNTDLPEVTPEPEPEGEGG